MSATTLAQLKPGQCAVVSGFSEESALTQRIMQMGILEGVDVEFVRRAPAGDPVEVRVMGYAISLRLAEAGLIKVEAAS